MWKKISSLVSLNEKMSKILELTALLGPQRGTNLLLHEPARLKWGPNVAVVTSKSHTPGNQHGFQTVDGTFAAFLQHLQIQTYNFWEQSGCCPKMKFKHLKNVCDEGNEQRSLEGEGRSNHSSTPNLIAFHPKTTTDCSSNHRQALRAASTQEAHSTRINIENTALEAAGLFLAWSMHGVNLLFLLSKVLNI